MTALLHISAIVTLLRDGDDLAWLEMVLLVLVGVLAADILDGRNKISLFAGAGSI